MIDQYPLTLQHKITFILLGIASLIGWNAILTAMDFFADYFPKDEYGDVSFIFPIPLFVGNFFWGLFVPKLAESFSITQRISVCLAAICVFMSILPILAIYLHNQTGFILCLITTFIIGSFNSVAQNSSIGLASKVDSSLTGRKLFLKKFYTEMNYILLYFPFQQQQFLLFMIKVFIIITNIILGLFWVSTGISGLTMNAARAIMLGVFGDNKEGTETGTIIYFAIAVILTLLAIWSQIVFVKSDYYNNLQQDIPIHVNLIDESNQTNSAASNQNENSQNSAQQNKVSIGSQLKEYGRKIILGVKAARFVPIFIWIIYVQTFMLFPGVSVFSKPKYHYLPDYWSRLLMLTLYNVGDIIGKYLSNFKFYSIPLLYCIVGVRFVFFFTFLMTMHQYDNTFFSNDGFAYSNMILFAITNGFTTGGLMLLGPQRGKNKTAMELIAFISSFSLTFGIACGSFLALTLSG